MFGTTQTRMFEGLRGAMETHARDAFPGEAFGAVFGSRDRPAYRPVDDVADNSRAGFRIEEAVLRRMEEIHGPLLAIVHTRSSTVARNRDVDRLLSIPSASEMRAQASLAVPFGVVVCDRSRCIDRFWFGDQCPVLPPLGRPFRHGVTDCYSLIRDFYRKTRDVLLPDYPRDWNWWIQGLDLYRAGFEEAGFRPVDPADADQADAVLFRMRSKVPNHAAVLLDGGWMLHHPASIHPYDTLRTSRSEPLARWKRHVTHWLRYEGQADSPRGAETEHGGSAGRSNEDRNGSRPASRHTL